MSSTRSGRASFWLAALGVGVLIGCRSVVPLGAGTRVGESRAAELRLVLQAPCTFLPGGTPMGRPDGLRSHSLPSGRYTPALEDADGVYFASPSGVSVTEPAPRGTRLLPGGVYVDNEGSRGWEYLGDAAGIRLRAPLPRSCRFQLEPADER